MHTFCGCSGYIFLLWFRNKVKLPSPNVKHRQTLTDVVTYESSDHRGSVDMGNKASITSLKSKVKSHGFDLDQKENTLKVGFEDCIYN